VHVLVDALDGLGAERMPDQLAAAALFHMQKFIAVPVFQAVALGRML
jgi:hypothetical protein